jgi:hypothetical protein
MIVPAARTPMVSSDERERSDDIDPSKKRERPQTAAAMAVAAPEKPGNEIAGRLTDPTER